MIKDNRILFGYGTVVVGSINIPGNISFQTSAVAHTVGESLEPESAGTGPQISIPMTLEFYMELSQNLQRVEKREIDTFAFCGYSLDFSNYNPGSIQVVRKHAKNAMSNYLMAMAC